jgi:hypothetical protein
MSRAPIFAALLFGLASPVAAQSNLEQTYRATLKELANVRVDYQVCVGDLTSTLRDVTEMILDWSETYKVMPRSKAADLVNDEQVAARAALDWKCQGVDRSVKRYDAVSNEFLKMAKSRQ